MSADKFSAPDDLSLIRRFEAERAAFEELRLMLLADYTVERVADDRVESEPGAPAMPPARHEKYREMFRHLGLDGGLSAYGGRNLIWFHAHSSGTTVGGSMKGYAYAAERPALVVADLDAHYARAKESGGPATYVAYRQLDGPWYLFHMVDE